MKLIRLDVNGMIVLKKFMMVPSVKDLHAMGQPGFKGSQFQKFPRAIKTTNTSNTLTMMASANNTRGIQRSEPGGYLRRVSSGGILFGVPVMLLPS